MNKYFILIDTENNSILGYSINVNNFAESAIEYIFNDIVDEEHFCRLFMFYSYDIVSKKLIFNEDAISKSSEISSKKAIIDRDMLELQNSDYKIVKCYEATLLQKPMPYDYVALIAQRDQWRDEINTLELELELLK